MPRIVTYNEGGQLLDSGFKGFVLTCYLSKGEYGIQLMTPIGISGARCTNHTLQKILSKDLNTTMEELWIYLVKQGFESRDFLDEKIIQFDLVHEDINYGHN